MTQPAQQQQMETVTISVTAILSRNYRNGAVFSGKDESGEHIRIVARYDAIVRTPALGEVWRAYGEFSEHPEYGTQFNAVLCEQLSPEGRLIILYLANNPKFKGVGIGKAKRLYAHFGDSLPEILSDGNTQRLEEVMTPIAALRMVEAWQSERAANKIMIFLDRHGFSPRLATKIQQCWGEKTIEVINLNPYYMLAFAGWDVVDNAARNIGIEFLDERRLIGAVEACLYNRLNNKHTLTKHPILLRLVRALLRVDAPVAEQAIALALRDKAIVGNVRDGYQAIGAASIEANITKRLLNIHNGILPSQARINDRLAQIGHCFLDEKIRECEIRYGISLRSEQRDAVKLATTKPVSVLTGGAGVGKTTVLRIIVDIAEELSSTVYQMALAGRAAQRIKEATGRNAMTIAGFITNIRNERLHIKENSLIIIDEASMLDLPTMLRILRYLPDGIRLLLVGDPYQLPPIGFGLVFHKLTESSTIPRVELKYVYRQEQSTGIPSVADAIRNGLVPQIKPFEGVVSGVSFIECAPRDIVHRLFEVATELNQAAETQILSPIKSGLAGVRAINDHFHDSISKIRPRKKLWRFAVGDPIIHLENDYERLLFNGTLGHITDIISNKFSPALVCDFDGITHILGEPDFDKVDLAYGITVHKAQGSQFKKVAVPIVKSRLLDRTLIYTALTRGIEQVVFLGDRSSFNRAIIESPSDAGRSVGFSI